MTTRQGDLALLDHPVAQRLLVSTSPARLAYVWTDGTPRVVPIGFYWNGTELVLGTPPDAPKTKALVDRPKSPFRSTPTPCPTTCSRSAAACAPTSSTESPLSTRPWHSRTQGEQAGRAWLDNLRQMSPQMTRVYVAGMGRHPGLPASVPSALERAMERAATAG